MPLAQKHPDSWCKAKGEPKTKTKVACDIEREENQLACTVIDSDPVALMGANASKALAPSLAATPTSPSKLLKTVSWLHIPKCGSSAAVLLASVLRINPCCVNATLVCMLSPAVCGVSQPPPPALPRPVSYWPPGWGEHTPLDEHAYRRWRGHHVGFFREPRARAVSAIAFWGKPATLTLPEALQRTAGTATRMLAGQAHGVECNDQRRFACASVRPPADRALALKRLEEGFAFVGLTDAWPLSVCLFHAMHGGSCALGQLANTNPGRLPPFFSSRDVEANATAFTDADDAALFAAARRRFCADLAAHDVTHASCKRRHCAVVAPRLRAVPAHLARPGERAALCEGREATVLRFVAGDGGGGGGAAAAAAAAAAVPADGPPSPLQRRAPQQTPPRRDTGDGASIGGIQRGRAGSCYATPRRRHETLRGSWEWQDPAPLELAMPQPPPYWNLSCPLEWSKYSCVHQGAGAHARRAASLRFRPSDCTRLPPLVDAATAAGGALSATDIEGSGGSGGGISGGALLDMLLRGGRRLSLVGDSLLRQVFVALGCALGTRLVVHRDVHWADASTEGGGWPCHGTRNCVPRGEHSGFFGARLVLRGGGEISFRGADADELQTGRVARNLGGDDWLVVMTGAHAAVTTEHHLAAVEAVTARNRGASGVSSDTSQSNHRTHQQRRGNSTPPPRLVWAMTPQSSFHSPNGTGLYDIAFLRGRSGGSGTGTGAQDRRVREDLLAAERGKMAGQDSAAAAGEACAAHVPDLHSAAEWAALRARPQLLASLWGVLHLEGLNTLGAAKIGGGVGAWGDCTHYCMPGVPDVMARALVAMMLGAG